MKKYIIIIATLSSDRCLYSYAVNRIFDSVEDAYKVARARADFDKRNWGKFEEHHFNENGTPTWLRSECKMNDPSKGVFFRVREYKIQQVKFNE